MIPPLLEVFSSLNVHIVEVFLLVCSHHVSSYIDHYYHHSTCDCCVLWNIPHHHDNYTCSNLYGPDNIGSAECGSAMTVDSKQHIEGFCWHQTCTTATASVLGVLCLWVYLLGAEPPTDSYVMYFVSVMVFAFRCPCGCMLICGAHILGLQHHNPFEFTLGMHLCLLVMVHSPCWDAVSGCCFYCLDLEGASHYSSCFVPAILAIWWGIQLWTLVESHLVPPPSIHGGKGSTFAGSAPPNDMDDFESVVGVKLSDSGVVIRYQVDEFTHTLGQQSVSLFDHTFILVSWVRCPHWPTSHLNQAVRIFPFWTRQWRILNMVCILFSQGLSTH